ncbi:phospholipase a2 domain-containing protein [Ditylenchus destructor]|uniref:Phospholipase a2 domain-containing protein n=1 Tax=Ditylenchus destructor TaxID=166010 RepID=A0AAD4MGN6_9BILA|nr:phospholipase a2 domain-containing protein [Ditylenchus destructor]
MAVLSYRLDVRGDVISRLFVKQLTISLYAPSYWLICGLGDSGGPPIDEIDECCRIHDKCYETSDSKGCNPYLWPYPGFPPQFPFGPLHCVHIPDWVPDWVSRCPEMVCVCDRDLLDCFAKYDQPRFPKSCIK